MVSAYGTSDERMERKITLARIPREHLAAGSKRQPRRSQRAQERRKPLVWDIDERLQEEGARPVIFHTRGATCWHPQVKGLTTMGDELPRCAVRRSGCAGSTFKEVVAGRRELTAAWCATIPLGFDRSFFDATGFSVPRSDAGNCSGVGSGTEAWMAN
jgi:hypothetical protein